MKTEPETISVTDLRERTREILESAYFRGKCYRVERAGQEMVVIVGVDEYHRLSTQATRSIYLPPNQYLRQSGDESDPK